LLLIWGAAVCFNGLSPIVVPLLFITCLVYAAAMAILGLWMSVMCRTSVRAIMATLLVALMLSVGHWLPWMCCLPSYVGPPDNSMDFIFQLQGALTPPAVVAGYLPMSPLQLSKYDISSIIWNPVWVMFISMFGTCCWGLFAWSLWLMANERFKKIGGRLDHVQAAPILPLNGEVQGTAPVVRQRVANPDQLPTKRGEESLIENADSSG